jgi:hypothetical protein
MEKMGKQLSRTIDFLVLCYESMRAKKEESFAERKRRERHELSLLLEIKSDTVRQIEGVILRNIEKHCCIMFPIEFRQFENLPISKRRVAAEELLVKKFWEIDEHPNEKGICISKFPFLFLLNRLS